MIEISNLTKKYNGKMVLNNISITIKDNQIIGLLGQNGCGKTTLLKILAGLLQDYDGSIKVNGKDLSPDTKAIMNFLPANSSLNQSWSVDKTIRYYSDMFPSFNEDKARQIISGFGLDSKEKIKNMSSGMREKVEIALTMSQKSDIYLLDEPLGGIDVSIRRKILENIIRNYSDGALMLISTHLISEVETILDRAIIIKDHKIYDDISVEDIREKHNLSVEEYFVSIFEEDYNV